MNLSFHSRHVQYPPQAAHLLEEGLIAIAERFRVEEAVVRLVDEREASPRYQVSIYLRLPGPDFNASACDHTVTVAARKAMRLLESQLADRAERSRRRRRSNLQHSSASRVGRAW